MLIIDRNPSEKTLRQFGVLVLPLFLLVLGVLALRRGQSPVLAWALWGAGAASATVGLISPRALRPIFVGLLYATFPVGWVVSHGALLLIFALCLVPLGLLGRLLRRDRMGRRFDRAAPTYWVERRSSPDLARYLRPF